MARRANRSKVSKPRKHESLEPRVVMSADPLGGPMMSLHGSTMLDEPPMLSQHGSGPSFGTAIVESEVAYDPNADFWFDLDKTLTEQEDLGQRVEQTLFEANQLTGQDQVVSTFGFDGAGQTVAVLDTGIAYGHYALGGGVGEGYRIVGGWDFTENDADFYDDGPNGGHGTHVAGIVGADSSSNHKGVATGVDLVGLRVFDDAGNGYFSWVEQALQWVHQHRFDYANPITAINLSLGTEWNSDNNPGWAMLEDEFAQLEADGIFIAVSAGNSYQNYNANGVSYPASSDHVVPVMSVDNNGQLSYFSQRTEYALAAPGRSITSTVPDYAANDADTIDDDWLSMSGTSMASPYVAGASTLVRQAMEFVGQTGIDQWDIYDHLMATADSFYDSASSTTYKRLNLWSAIDALMPEDDYGSSQVDAYSLGTLNDTSGATPLSALSGVISTLDDGDYFSFTAGATGTVTIAASGVTHELVASWDAWGGDSWSVNEAGECVIDVVAGQTYTFAISSSDGLGYYDLSVNLESSFAAIEWGSVGPQETRTGQSISGEQWYSVTASRTGYFTAETLPTDGAVTVAIYDAEMNPLVAAGSRADVQVQQGDMIYLRVEGESGDYDLRMTNALSVSGGVATLVGTSAADELRFFAGGASHLVSLNGVQYSVSNQQATHISIQAGGGYDSIKLYGSAGDDVATVSRNLTTVTDGAYTATVSNAEDVHVYGQAGTNTATLNDTSGADSFYAYSDRAVMDGSGYFHRVLGFGRVDAYSTAGSDRAYLYDSEGDDTVEAYESRVEISGTGYHNEAYGFSRFDAFSSVGYDTANLYGSSADETVYAKSDKTLVVGGAMLQRVLGFDRVDSYSGGGTDRAFLYDTNGADTLRAYADRSIMEGDGYVNRVLGFTRVDAYATTGDDYAQYFDTEGDDQVWLYQNRTLATGDGYMNQGRGFDRSDAYSTGGADRAWLYGSSGSETVRAYSDRVVLESASVFNRALGFGRVDAYGSGGTDSAQLWGSAGVDTISVYDDRTVASGDSYLNRICDFDDVQAFDLEGQDKSYDYSSQPSSLGIASVTHDISPGEANQAAASHAFTPAATAPISNARAVAIDSTVGLAALDLAMQHSAVEADGDTAGCGLIDYDEDSGDELEELSTLDLAIALTDGWS